MNQQHTSDQFFEPTDWAQDIAKVWKSFCEKMILKFEGQEFPRPKPARSSLDSYYEEQVIMLHH